MGCSSNINPGSFCLLFFYISVECENISVALLRGGARQADKSESLYQNRVRQRGNTPENERKSARIYARHRRQIRTRVQFPKRRQLYNDRLRPLHRNSSDDSRICITKTAGTVKKFLPFSLILYIPVHRFRECTSSDCSRR